MEKGVYNHIQRLLNYIKKQQCKETSMLNICLLFAMMKELVYNKTNQMLAIGGKKLQTKEMKSLQSNIGK